MGDDPLDMVLRLVADGRLSAEEAAPLLAALDAAAGGPQTRAGAAGTSETRPRGDDSRSATGSPRTLLVEVREAGRTVVNLRLPLALGVYAVDRIPGLSAEQVGRVLEAMKSGLSGPVLRVQDGDDSVRIEIE